MTVHLTWNGGQALAAIGRASEQAVAAVSAAVEKEAKVEARRLIYQTPETPNYVRTGNLLNSIQHRTDGLTGQVEAKADYAIYVHEGTRFVAARPFLRNGVTRVMRRIDAILEAVRVR